MHFLTTLVAVAAAISTTLASSLPVPSPVISFCGTQPYYETDVCILTYPYPGVIRLLQFSS